LGILGIGTFLSYGSPRISAFSIQEIEAYWDDMAMTAYYLDPANREKVYWPPAGAHLTTKWLSLMINFSRDIAQIMSKGDLTPWEAGKELVAVASANATPFNTGDVRLIFYFLIACCQISAQSGNVSKMAIEMAVTTGMGAWDEWKCKRLDTIMGRRTEGGTTHPETVAEGRQWQMGPP